MKSKEFFINCPNPKNSGQVVASFGALPERFDINQPRVNTLKIITAILLLFVFNGCTVKKFVTNRYNPKSTERKKNFRTKINHIYTEDSFKFYTYSLVPHKLSNHSIKIAGFYNANGIVIRNKNSLILVSNPENMSSIFTKYKNVTITDTATLKKRLKKLFEANSGTKL